jgi:hypothetical protein
MTILQRRLPSRRLRVIIGVGGIVLLLLFLLWHLFPPITLNMAQARWQAHKIDDYQIRVRVFGAPNSNEVYTVTVHDEQVQHADCTGVLLFPSETCTARARWLTISGLFARVEQMYQEQRNYPAIDVTATFDAAYGFPRSLSRTDPTVFDGYSYITVEHFDILHR